MRVHCAGLDEDERLAAELQKEEDARLAQQLAQREEQEREQEERMRVSWDEVALHYYYFFIEDACMLHRERSRSERKMSGCGSVLRCIVKEKKKGGGAGNEMKCFSFLLALTSDLILHE